MVCCMWSHVVRRGLRLASDCRANINARAHVRPCFNLCRKLRPLVTLYVTCQDSCHLVPPMRLFLFYHSVSIV